VKRFQASIAALAGCASASTAPLGTEPLVAAAGDATRRAWLLRFSARVDRSGSASGRACGMRGRCMRGCPRLTKLWPRSSDSSLTACDATVALGLDLGTVRSTASPSSPSTPTLSMTSIPARCPSCTGAPATTTVTWSSPPSLPVFAASGQPAHGETHRPLLAQPVPTLGRALTDWRIHTTPNAAVWPPATLAVTDLEVHTAVDRHAGWRSDCELMVRRR
jgi:hypothetical protein